MCTKLVLLGLTLFPRKSAPVQIARLPTQAFFVGDMRKIFWRAKAAEFTTVDGRNPAQVDR